MTHSDKAAGSGEIDVGRAEIALTLNVSAREITNLVKAHHDFPSTVTGRARTFPLRRCVQWYVRFKSQEAVKRAKPATPSNVEEMNRRRAEADMKMAEMDVAEREGRLVSVIHVDQVVGELCDRMRATIVNIPGNFGLRLEELNVAPAQAEAVLSAIAEELTQALRGVADDVDELGEQELPQESSDDAADDSDAATSD
jgi:phage terminase Nu1 subunit (DNA packaging protein)